MTAARTCPTSSWCKPIYLSGKLIGFSSALAHMTDIGGRIPGGNASDSTEIYQEGLRIPPSRLWRDGLPDETLFRIIERNVRVPDKVIGDIRSLIAACTVGEREFVRLAQRYGAAEFEQYCRDLLDYTERFTRAEIAKLPKGTWRFVDYLDGDGIDPGAIKFVATVTIAEQDLTIDFTGTAPQVRGAINCVYPFTLSTALACVRSIVDLSIPNNSGYFRPITVIAPEGTIVNPRSPAAVAARGITGVRIADTVFGALAQAVPHIVPACGSNLPEVGVSFGGVDEDGKSFVYLEFLLASWGGGPDHDGMDACTGTLVNYSNTPAEMIEADTPIAIERYGFVPDTGGAGRWRGGLAVERHLRFKSKHATLQIRSDRREHLAYGLEGGGPGRRRRSRSGASTGARRPRQVPHDRRTRRPTPCAPVRRRRPRRPLDARSRAVLEDVLEQKVTLAHARDAYGVVVADDLIVDDAGTAAARAARASRTPPKGEFP